MHQRLSPKDTQNFLTMRLSVVVTIDLHPYIGMTVLQEGYSHLKHALELLGRHVISLRLVPQQPGAITASRLRPAS